MTDRQFTLSSGRKLGVTAVGEALSMHMVVMCHPIGGAGNFDPRPIVSRKREVRLLGFDRPGYGGSEPLRDGESSSVQARSDDIAEFLMSTEMREERVEGPHLGAIGWGFGGAVALSLAARYPKLIAHTVVVGLSFNELTFEGDDSALKFAGASERLDHMFAEATVQGSVGVETDRAAVQDLSWADELDDMEAPATFVYGTDDPSADASTGKRLQRRIPHAQVARVPHAGSLAIVNAWPRILDKVVA